MQSVLFSANQYWKICSNNFDIPIWISTLHLDDDDDDDDDSSGEIYISTATERAIAKIVCTPLPKIFVRHMKCPKQTNGNYCGVYAIANMVSILHGIDPSSISFNVSAMRRNLQQGLENKKITVFPIENCLLSKSLC